MFRCKNLLLTGGAGFIGSNFIKYFFEKYDKTNIINLDALTYAGNLKNLSSIQNNGRYRFIEGNICDKDLVEKIFSKYEIDGVINFAAESHVDNSILNPDIFIKTNINGVYNLLSTAFKYWMDKPFKVKDKFKNSRFHQISTDEVYGSINSGSFSEESKYSPNSPYSSSKASADMIVRSFNKTFGLDTTISISSNNFGPNQHKEKFIPMIINSLLENKKIKVYGDGNNIRDWIYVIDNCKAIDKIFCEAKSGKVYNVSGENELNNLELIDIIYELMSKYVEVHKQIEFVKDRFGHDKRYSLSQEKFKRELHWEHQINFKISLEKYITNLIQK